MIAQRTYQVGDVSRIARISIRTPHYYDEIGLLVPTVRTEAGYRLYTDEDPAKYEVEVQERWGDHGAYQEAHRRTERYSQEDWGRFRSEAAVIYADADRPK